MQLPRAFFQGMDPGDMGDVERKKVKRFQTLGCDEVNLGDGQKTAALVEIIEQSMSGMKVDRPFK